MGNLILDQGGFEPCTPAGIMQLLKRCGVELKGKRAVVVGPLPTSSASPWRSCSLREHATVTICHSRTQDLPGMCREADILVAAMGKPAFITHDFIKPGAVVVDVGINRVTDPAEAARFSAATPSGSSRCGRRVPPSWAMCSPRPCGRRPRSTRPFLAAWDRLLLRCF